MTTIAAFDVEPGYRSEQNTNAAFGATQVTALVIVLWKSLSVHVRWYILNNSVIAIAILAQ